MLLTGCATVHDRLTGSRFGAYPYQSTADEIRNLKEDAAYDLAITPLDLCGVPFDVVFDTLFLPLDLIFWLGRVHKIPLE